MTTCTPAHRSGQPPEKVVVVVCVGDLWLLVMWLKTRATVVGSMQRQRQLWPTHRRSGVDIDW
jgi:hypothetical protein